MSKWKQEKWLKKVSEIYNKDLIDADQVDTLNLMIKSSDSENFTMAEETIKVLIRTKLSQGLNQGQVKVFEEVIDYLENPEHQALVLKGYAGTGKTFLIKRILEYIVFSTDNKRIAIGAPTNKAVSVIYKNSMSAGLNGYVFESLFDTISEVTYSTIHKLLGLKEIITNEGQQLFEVDSINNSELINYQYLIVDEVSMLDDKICNDIMKFCNNVKIIFMGDPAQIPPINRNDCIPFKSNTKYNFKITELTEIMRQKGNHPIIDLSFQIRKNLNKSQPIPVLQTKLNEHDHGLVYMDNKTDKALIKPLLKKYFKSSMYEEDTDYIKVIAWKNKTVEYVNQLIREILYGPNLPKFVVKENLIVLKPVFEEDKSSKNYNKWRIILNTSEELVVESVFKNYMRFKEGNFSIGAFVYTLVVKSYDPSFPDTEFFNTINVIHEDSAQEYKNVLDNARNHAVKSKQAKDWVRYFNMVKWSANVSYNYAITAHKSQGSTYKNVLILEDDIDCNRKTLERNRIKYTAYSRATDKLFVLRENHANLITH
jgi:exodeoxyribonuclease-5